jgi:diaminopimelate epimerase
MTELALSKYQGTGNDFLLFLDLDDDHPIDARTAITLCDRRFGVGADGVIRITRAEGVDAVMDHRNADGSRAQMCGNGIRCVAAMMHDRGLAGSHTLRIGTPVGLRRVSLKLEGGAVSGATVDMGSPVFDRGSIPMRGPADRSYLEESLDVGEATVKASALSMGNPHLVLFWDGDLASAPVEQIGPRLERNDRFPERTNVEFVQPRGGDLAVRVWERGAGETMACGTGACAALVAAHEAGLTGPRAKVRFPGGTVHVSRGAEGGVTLAGDARHVFDGAVDVAELSGRPGDMW